MRLYFSGVAGKSEADMLKTAGVTHVLVDPTDMLNAAFGGFRNIALDSGAYRIFKKGGELDIHDYLDTVHSYGWDFCMAPDVIGDPEATKKNWQFVRLHNQIIPVWQWGASEEDLKFYLDERELVAIGGLVPLMRAKDEDMLAHLTALCERYPRRFHLLGVNWLKAIERLKDLVYSGDTSKHMDGGRYGHVIFKHSKTGHLQQAPAKLLKTVTTREGVLYPDLDRVGRCVECARNLLEVTEQ